MKQGRNEKCNCGSGMKYKKCCIKDEVHMSNMVSDTLSAISCFYKNDKPEGIGLTIWDTDNATQMKNSCITMYNACVRHMKQTNISKQEMIEDLESQLNDYIGFFKDEKFKTLDRDMKMSLQLIIWTNIYSLEQLGGITPDEFNGMQFMYGPKTNGDDMLPLFEEFKDKMSPIFM